MAYFKCGGSSGASILHGSSNPSASEGSNGQIYLKTSAAGEDLSGYTVSKESSMTVTKSRNKIDFVYGSGGSIGGQAYTAIDLTDIDEIGINITCGNKAYQSDFATRHPRFVIVDSVPSSYPTTPVLAEVSTAGTSNSFTIDVSSYTGTQYIVFSGNGCSCSFDTLTLDGVTYDLVESANLKVNGSWTDLIGSNLNDVNL